MQYNFVKEVYSNAEWILLFYWKLEKEFVKIILMSADVDVKLALFLQCLTETVPKTFS